jgi:hypothetical protein
MIKKLKFHPAANIFPLMEGEEFAALVADIKANGLHEQIVKYKRKILDGRNRYRACLAAGWDLDGWISDCTDVISDPVAYVISKNIHRRHLTAKKRREIIAALIKAKPEQSDRQVAETVKASPTTVGTVRAELEEAGDVSKLDTRTDTTGRQQPATKPGPVKFPNVLAAVMRRDGKSEQEIFEATGVRPDAGNDSDPAASAERMKAAHAAYEGEWCSDEEAREHVERQCQEGRAERHREEDARAPDDLAEKLRAAEIKIVGLESEIEDLKAENATWERTFSEADDADTILVMGEKNFRDWLLQSYAGAESARKVIKESHFEDQVWREFLDSVDRIIRKWKTIRSALESKQDSNEPAAA